jgi:hypothetical protein
MGHGFLLVHISIIKNKVLTKLSLNIKVYKYVLLYLKEQKMAIVETWFVTNNYSESLALSDIISPYIIKAGETVDLLKVGNNTPENLANSAIIRNYTVQIIKKGVNKGQTYISAVYDHSHEGLDVLTGGTSSDADSLHTHDKLTTEEDVNSLITAAIDNIEEEIDLTDFVKKSGSINQLSDITSSGAVIESAVSMAHTDHIHNSLSGLNEGDYQHLTSGDYANLSTLTSGGNADGLHIHSSSAITHNDLSGLQGGVDSQYYHLTESQHDTLTDGSNADSLHIHSSSCFTHNSLSGLQGGNGIDEFYHLTEDENDLVGRLGVDSSGLTFDGMPAGMSGSLWIRSGTTLYPEQGGDSVDLGTGDFTTTGTITGEQITSTDDITMAGLLANTLAAADVIGIDNDGDTNPYTGSASNYSIKNVRTIATPASTIGFSSWAHYNYLTNSHVVNGSPGVVTVVNYCQHNQANITSAHSATPILALEEYNYVNYNTFARTGTITGQNTTIFNNGVYNETNNTVTLNSVGSVSVYNYGIRSRLLSAPTLTSGTLNTYNYGVYNDITSNSVGTSINYLYYGIISGSADTNWLLYMDGSHGDNYLGGDNIKTYFGTGKDASIYYDNHDLIISPNEVGSGQVVIEDNGDFDSGIGIGFDRDYARFNIEGQGSEDTSNNNTMNAWLDMRLEPSATITVTKNGLQNIIGWQGTQNVTGDIRVFNNICNVTTAATSGTIDEWSNMDNRLNQAADEFSGTITEFYMFRIVNNKMDATNINITNWYGFYHPDVDFTGTNNSAIEIGDITGATNNYAIKTGLGQVVFGDDVSIDSNSSRLYFGENQESYIFYDGQDLNLGFSNPSIGPLTQKVRVNDDISVDGDLGVDGILTVGTSSISINGDDLEIYSASNRQSIISIGKNRIGDGTDLGSYLTGIGLEFFKNATNYVAHNDANNHNPSLAFYGATNLGQKYGTIGIDDYRRMVFGGTVTGIVFSQILEASSGLNIGSNATFTINRGHNFSVGDYAMMYGTTFVGTGQRALRFMDINQRWTNLGNTNYSNPTFFVHCSGDTEANAGYLQLYHDNVSAHIISGKGGINFGSSMLYFGENRDAFIQYDGQDLNLGFSNPSIGPLTQKVRINDDLLVDGILTIGTTSMQIDGDNSTITSTSGTIGLEDDNLTTTGTGRFDGGVGVGANPSSQSRIFVSENIGNSTYFGLNFSATSLMNTNAISAINFSFTNGEAAGDNYIASNITAINTTIINWDTIGTQVGVQVNLAANLGTITNSTGVNISCPIGTVTNNYGLQITNCAGSSIGTAIKTGTGILDIGDEIQVNGDSRAITFGVSQDAQIQYISGTGLQITDTTTGLITFSDDNLLTTGTSESGLWTSNTGTNTKWEILSEVTLTAQTSPFAITYPVLRPTSELIGNPLAGFGIIDKALYVKDTGDIGGAILIVMAGAANADSKYDYASLFWNDTDDRFEITTEAKVGGDLLLEPQGDLLISSDLLIDSNSYRLYFGENKESYIFYNGQDLNIGFSNPSIGVLTQKVRINDDLLIDGHLEIGGEVVGTTTFQEEIICGGDQSGQSIIDSGLVVNEGGGSASTDDFRVETVSIPTAFVVDASADQIEMNVPVVVDGDVSIDSNSSRLYFGHNQESFIFYNGTNLNIGFASPSIGPLTQVININDDLAVDGYLSVFGEFVLEGDATTWDDVRIVPGAFSFPGVADPTLEDWQPGGSGATLKVYKFKKNDEVHASCQMPHTYKEGSDLHFHIHWTPAEYGAAESGALVGWKIDYTAANINGVYGPTATVDLSDACSGVNHQHEITSDVLVSGAGLKISHIIMVRIYRSDTGGDDTWASVAADESPALLEFDIHFEINMLGSRQRLVK